MRQLRRCRLGPFGRTRPLLREGASTKGHYRVCDKLLAVTQECDPGAETEPLGLIASRPALRPADILTTAAHSGRLAALDVGIVAPEASGSGLDCTAAMYATKHARYASYRDELDRSNVLYMPMVWSAFGRPHPETSRVIRLLSKKVARRRGLASAATIERRARAKIGVEIWWRAACMVMACLPHFDDEDGGPGAEDCRADLGRSEAPHAVQV